MRQQPIMRFLYRTIKYVIILTSTFYILKFIFGFFNLLYTDIDNARYLLSAMAQSQAAIIAIIITMSLVAVQLGATAYSPRVINIFKSNPDLWILLALYGTSISYDFIILKVLSERISEFCFFISCWLCASALLVLFPYMLSIIDILKPEAIVKRLVEDICIPCFRNEPMIGKGWRIGDLEGNPFQPIIDIACGAFMKYDYETVKIGLRRMIDKVIFVINSCDIEKYKFISGKRNPSNPFERFSECYCKHLEQIGKLFAERDENLTLETIENLADVARAITKKKIKAEGCVLEALGNIGRISAKNEFQEATNRAIDAIGIIAKSIPFEDYTKTLPNGYKDLYPYNHIIGKAVSNLRCVSVPAIQKWGVYELQTVGKNLKKAGISIAMEGQINNWHVIDIARTFKDIGIIALNVEKNINKITDFILHHHVIMPLSTIGKIAYEKRIIPDEKGYQSGFSKIVYALWTVGGYASIKGFNETAKVAAKELAKLAILDEKIVKIELNSSIYGETKIESFEEFQKFIKIYKKYLKGLRVSSRKTSGSGFTTSQNGISKKNKL